jgi:hypothetical protein
VASAVVSGTAATMAIEPTSSATTSWATSSRLTASVKAVPWEENSSRTGSAAPA